MIYVPRVEKLLKPMMFEPNLEFSVADRLLQHSTTLSDSDEFVNAVFRLKFTQYLDCDGGASIQGCDRVRYVAPTRECPIHSWKRRLVVCKTFSLTPVSFLYVVPQ